MTYALGSRGASLSSVRWNMFQSSIKNIRLPQDEIYQCARYPQSRLAILPKHKQSFS